MANRWFALLVMTRVMGTAVALALLALHRVTPHDGVLAGVVVAYACVSLLLMEMRPALRGMPAVWVADAVLGLGLVWWSGDWRSPFYVLALTTLVLPVTTLRFRAGMLWGTAFAGAYAGVGILTERLGSTTLEDSIRLETAATHLMVPLLVALALAYASELLARLGAERKRAERLAVHAERQRIAWELHDSAKQRVHAAHLVLSGLPAVDDDVTQELVEHALKELGAAAAEMDTSVGELRTPLDGQPLEALLQRRADELAPATRARVTVVGALPDLAPPVVAHCYRIVAEALTNAVRHADPDAITIVMDPRDCSVTVADDGIGLASSGRAGSNGIRTMHDRARTIGARLDIGPGPGGRGTTVRLLIPTRNSQGASAT